MKNHANWRDRSWAEITKKPSAPMAFCLKHCVGRQPRDLLNLPLKAVAPVQIRSGLRGTAKAVPSEEASAKRRLLPTWCSLAAVAPFGSGRGYAYSPPASPSEEASALRRLLRVRAREDERVGWVAVTVGGSTRRPRPTGSVGVEAPAT